MPKQHEDYRFRHKYPKTFDAFKAYAEKIGAVVTQVKANATLFLNPLGDVIASWDASDPKNTWMLVKEDVPEDTIHRRTDHDNEVEEQKAGPMSLNDVITSMLTPRRASDIMQESVPSDIKPSETPKCDGHTKQVYEFMLKQWERIQKEASERMIEPDKYWAYMIAGLKKVTDVNEVALLDFGVPAAVVVETLKEGRDDSNARENLRTWQAMFGRKVMIVMKDEGLCKAGDELRVEDGNLVSNFISDSTSYVDIRHGFGSTEDWDAVGLKIDSEAYEAALADRKEMGRDTWQIYYILECLQRGTYKFTENHDRLVRKLARFIEDIDDAEEDDDDDEGLTDSVRTEAEADPKAAPAAPAKADDKAPAAKPKAFEYKTLHVHRKGGKVEKIPLEQVYPKLEPFTKKHFKHPREALMMSHPDQVLKVFQKLYGADVEQWSVPAEKNEAIQAPVFAALFATELLKGVKSKFVEDKALWFEAFDKADRKQLELLFPNVQPSYLDVIINESKTVLDEIGDEQVNKLFPNIDMTLLVGLKESELAALAGKLAG